MRGHSVAAILLHLPDGRCILQRRDNNAPLYPGKLTFFGGSIEGEESALEAARRELSEETSLDVRTLNFEQLATYLHPDLPASQIVVFIVSVPDTNFDVYEGEGYYVTTLDRAIMHPDTSNGTRIGLVYGIAKDGEKHV